jgi:hypothetical protein
VDNAPPNHGEWWASAATSSLLRALDQALQATPSLRSERVEDVLVDPMNRRPEDVLLRCVEFVDAGDAAPRSAEELADWSMSSWKAHNDSVTTGCDAALLTHTFSWPTGAAAAAAEGRAPATEELCLRMLVTTSAADTPLLQTAFFGQDAVMLRAGGSRCACVVSLRSDGGAASGAGETRIISEEVAAAMPLPLRSALKQCRRAQVLAALAACVRRRWLGGLLLLSDVAVPLLQRDDAVAAESLQSLTSQLRFSLVTSGTNLGVTQLTWDSCMEPRRVRAAEALEARGEFVAAAALYKSCITDDMRVPGGVSRDPAILWQYYGLALKRAGDIAGAKAAYMSGIALLASGCRVSPNVPQRRETQRLLLFINILNITPAEQYTNVCVPMFEPAVPALRSWGRQLICVHGYTGTWIEHVSSGCRYAVVEDGAIGSASEEPGDTTSGLQCIARLPDRVGAFVPPNDDDHASAPDPGRHVLVVLPMRAADDSCELETLGARSLLGPGAVLLPKLIHGTCAACGAVRAALKRCAACGLVEYCDSACQNTHWRQHKRSCRAAVAAATAELD